MRRRRNRDKCSEDSEKTNRISVADFEIESNVASLIELEECLNRVIRRNKKFAEFRRKKVMSEHMGMIG